MIQTNRAIPGARIRLMIFDLDGTLVDSRQDLANSVNATLEHFRRPRLEPDTIARFIGDGAPTLVRRSLGFADEADLPHKDEEFVEEALIFFLDYYREHKLEFTYVYDGVIEALDWLAKPSDGKETVPAMAVLSNKPVGPSRAIVDALGLGKYFQWVYGGNSFETKKPDPLGVQMLLQQFHAKPEQAVIIGDSHVDIETAHNAGIYGIGVTYGLSPESLESARPDVTVDSPSEWMEIFK